MKVKTLKEKILELPDNLCVVKVYIEAVNKCGYSQTIEFEMNKNKLIIKKQENDTENKKG